MEAHVSALPAGLRFITTNLHGSGSCMQMWSQLVIHLQLLIKRLRVMDHHETGRPASWPASSIPTPRTAQGENLQRFAPQRAIGISTSTNLKEKNHHKSCGTCNYITARKQRQPKLLHRERSWPAGYFPREFRKKEERAGSGLGRKPHVIISPSVTTNFHSFQLSEMPGPKLSKEQRIKLLIEQKKKSSPSLRNRASLNRFSYCLSFWGTYWICGFSVRLKQCH